MKQNQIEGLPYRYTPHVKKIFSKSPERMVFYCKMQCTPKDVYIHGIKEMRKCNQYEGD